MGFLYRFLSSSIGKKVMVATAGLLLCGFLVVHLVGNLYLFGGESIFNAYSAQLEENPLLLLAEIGLAFLFLAHIIVSLKVTYENKKARPVGYVEYHSKGGRTWGSRTMIFSGLLLLAFLVVHIKTFKFGDNKEGLYWLVMTWFQNKMYVFFYVAAMLALGLHLSHGFQSAFQTFGVNHPRYTPWIKGVGWFFAVVVSCGFAILPLWACFIFNGRLPSP